MMLPKIINNTSFLVLQKIYTLSYQGLIWYIKQSIVCDYSYDCTLHYYTKPPECVDLIRCTSQGFHSWCLEARVRRTSAFRAPVGKTE